MTRFWLVLTACAVPWLICSCKDQCYYPNLMQGCPCPDGTVFCKVGPSAYICADLSKEPNCGACNTVCGSGSCVAGQCVCAPPPVGACPPPPGGGGEMRPPWTVCRDLTTEGNCGGCGIHCGDLGSCVSGACVCGPPPVQACPPPSPWSGEWWTICWDLTRDGACGGCGIWCGRGSCQSGTCICDPPPVKSCPPPDPIPFPEYGWAVCIDVSSDFLNCGDCGIRCNYNQYCVNGRCQ